MSPNLKTRIMRRVYVVWFLRQALSARSMKVMIVLASLWQIKQLVYVKAVIANMPKLTDLAANYNFFSYALLHTQFAVQLSILVSGVLMVWIASDTLKRQPGYWF